MVTEVSGVSVDPSTDGHAVSLSHALPSLENGWPPRPYQIVSLLDVKKYQLSRLQDLALIQVGLFLNPVGGVTKFPKGAITKEHLDKFIHELDHFRKHLKYLGLNHSVKYLDLIRAKLGKSDYEYEDYERDITTLQEWQDIELSEIVTGFIPADKVPYFRQNEFFGQEVNARFPSAAQDIQDAANCYAYGLNTACVFHLMRVVEIGARAMIRDLRVGSLLVNRNKDKVPIELCDWNTLVTALQKGVDSLVVNTSTSAQRKKRFEFYNHALAAFRNFKDAWRNHVSHTREPYLEGQTKDIIDNVKQFMVHLSKRLREPKRLTIAGRS